MTWLGLVTETTCRGWENSMFLLKISVLGTTKNAYCPKFSFTIYRGVMVVL